MYVALLLGLAIAVVLVSKFVLLKQGPHAHVDSNHGYGYEPLLGSIQALPSELASIYFVLLLIFIFIFSPLAGRLIRTNGSKGPQRKHRNFECIHAYFFLVRLTGSPPSGKRERKTNKQKNELKIIAARFMNCQCNRRYVVVCASMAVAVLLLSTFDNLPALLTSVDDAFGYDDGGGDAWDDGTLAGEHAALFYPRKTMWFAGLNAREAFSNPYNVPTVRWTAAVEDAMQTVFDSVYHPAAERDCADPAVRFVVHQWIEYGITSEMRDLLSLTLVGLIDKRIVHLQPCDWGARCPRHYFDLLASSCDGAYDLENKEAYPEYSLKRLHEDTRIFYVPTDSLINFAGDKHDSLFSTPGDLWFWDSLFSTGGITYHDAATGQPIAYEEVITRYHPKVVRHLHLSLIRSLAFKVLFSLSFQTVSGCFISLPGCI